MKSVKPGRGPSMMGGIMGIVVGVFGIIWTIIAASMGGGLFAIFGVVFVIIAVMGAVYNFKNATGKNRYSTFDITDSTEESDPLNERFGESKTEAWDGDWDNMPPVEGADATDSVFCPYCGAPVKGDFEFCNKCGRRLP